MKNVALCLALLMSCGIAVADTIAIIGTGKVGETIGTAFAEQGHTIIYGSRSPASLKALQLAQRTSSTAKTDTPSGAAEAASIIVLAVPGLVAVEVVSGLGDISGKLLIDVTNPLQTDDRMHFSHAVDTSNGELVQMAAETAVVVKALNTVPWQLMRGTDDKRAPISVPLSGDDTEAKAVVARLVKGMGLEPIDIGGIETSRWTEMTAVIMLNNRFTERPSFNLRLQQDPAITRQ